MPDQAVEQQAVEIDMNQMSTAVVQFRYAHIMAQVIKDYGYKVQSGPFTGMMLPKEHSWGLSGDLVPKILGCYEQELHPAIEKAIARKPKKIFNIGCAEGYYAIGLARRCPDAHVFAVDTDEKAVAVCYRAYGENDLNGNITSTVSSACLFKETKGTADRCLAVVDVEGDELPVLATMHTDGLLTSDIIVEMHPFITGPKVKIDLIRRLRDTHDFEIIGEGPRDPNQYASLRTMCSLDRWMAISENRPQRQEWLVAWARN